MPRTDILAVDFGTSNTAAAVPEAGGPRILPLERGAETMPTAVFLDFRAREMAVGEAAVAALVEGREGRFMRALKSVLGTALMHERRQFLNERLTLAEIVTRLIGRIRERAEAETGRRLEAVLSGRPVRFSTRDPERDARALADLEACYRAAGFAEVRFLPEPEAAALASDPDGAGLGLIVDIGGGTSDFTVFERTGGRIRVLASHGIRMGGTDFDRALSLTHVMPLLGKGSGLRAEFGGAVHPAPVGLFNDLATWETIPFLYTGQVRREVARMARVAVAPERFARLATVLTDELGHDVAFAVERAKIAAEDAGPGGAVIDLGMIEPGLACPLGAAALAGTLAEPIAEIVGAAARTLELADLPPARIERVVMVGGSSLLAPVAGAVRALMPAARVERAAAFTAVVRGLALAAADDAFHPGGGLR